MAQGMPLLIENAQEQASGKRRTLPTCRVCVPGPDRSRLWLRGKRLMPRQFLIEAAAQRAALLLIVIA